MAQDESTTQFVTRKEAEVLLAVCGRTLVNWAKAGRIEHFRTPGGKYRFNVKGYFERNLKPVKE